MPHVPDRHQEHDLALVAAFAADDVEAAERARASELVASCTDCAALADDLRVLTIGADDVRIPRRTRDFRLTPEQAASLRPSGVRGVLAALAGARFGFAAPLGSSLAALGVAGLLLTTAPAVIPASMPGGGDGAGAPAASLAAPAPAGSPEAAPSASTQALTGPADASPAASDTAAQASKDPAVTGDGSPVPDDATTRQDEGGSLTMAGPAEASPTPGWLAGGSVALVIVGLALVLTRVVARRTALGA